MPTIVSSFTSEKTVLCTLADEPPFKKYFPGFKQLPFGYIIGQVTLTDVKRAWHRLSFNASDEMMNKLTMEEKAFGDFTPGRFAWLLENAIAFKTPMGV